jgi:uncharacterized protein (TIGR03083 family)
MNQTRLSPERYFQLIDADAERLVAMGERGLHEPVPSCPGWDVAEVLWHTAVVFEHKVRVMADNAWPDPWPPAEFDDRSEIDFLRRAKDDLFAEFSRHDIDEQTTTFGSDSTIGFWARRMALEAAVHRYDAELAHAATTAIADDLAVDGVDEVLHVMLAGPWWSERVDTSHPVDAVVSVQTGGHAWSCELHERSASVADEADASAAATVSGAPEPVFRWLWGRADDSEIERAGEAAVAAEFRARLVECLG